MRSGEVLPKIGASDAQIVSGLAGWSGAFGLARLSLVLRLRLPVAENVLGLVPVPLLQGSLSHAGEPHSSVLI